MRYYLDIHYNYLKSTYICLEYNYFFNLCKNITYYPLTRGYLHLTVIVIAVKFHLITGELSP